MLLGQETKLRRGEAEESIMVPRAAGPQCGSRGYKRNGHTHTGEQNHRCKRCGRAFVLSPDNFVITAEQRTLIERLLLESISLLPQPKSSRQARFSARPLCNRASVGWRFDESLTCCVSASLCSSASPRCPSVMLRWSEFLSL